MKPEQFDECFTIGLTAAGEPVERPIRAMTGDEFLMAWEWHRDSAARLEEEGAAVLDRLSDKAEKERLTAIFKTKSRDEWCAAMEGSDVSFAPVLYFASATTGGVQVSANSPFASPIDWYTIKK